MQFVAEQQVVYMKRAEGELNELEAQSAKKEVRISAFAWNKYLKLQSYFHHLRLHSTVRRPAIA